MNFAQFVASRKKRDARIIALRKLKMTVEDIGRECGVSKQRVSQIIERERKRKAKRGNGGGR